MKLSPEQMAQFEEQGYLLLPSLFSPEEIGALNAEVPHMFAQHRTEVVREKGTDAPRTAFYVQTWNEAFARLARHPRLVEPGTQLLGSDKLYMHQFKINAKAAFDGAVWQWHQDFGTWYEDDMMPSARAMNIALFLEEANEFNGPLMFIPKSHR
jgi:ectoine hydroxylase